MRTTLTLDDDVAAEVDRLRREEGIGISAAVNRLIRNGLSRPTASEPFRNESHDMGLKVDITHIGAVLDLLDDH